MYDKSMGTPPHILFQMFDFYFHSWVDEVFSTYLKSEFWGLKLSSSRRAQTGVECSFNNHTHIKMLEMEPVLQGNSYWYFLNMLAMLLFQKIFPSV